MGGGDIPRRRPISEAWLLESALEHTTVHGTLQYSPQYSDDDSVYRHITVPRRVLKKARELLIAYNAKKGRPIPSAGNGMSTGAAFHGLIMSARKNEPLLPYEDIVTKLFIHMSSDWVLYLIHERDNTLCFRRARRDKAETSKHVA